MGHHLPRTTRRASLLSVLVPALVALRDRPHSSGRPRMWPNARRHARGVDGRWTNGRSPSVTTTPAVRPAALRAPRALGTASPTHPGIGPVPSGRPRRSWHDLARSPVSRHARIVGQHAAWQQWYGEYPREGNTFVIFLGKNTCCIWQPTVPAGIVKSREHGDSMGGISQAEQRYHDRYRYHG